MKSFTFVSVGLFLLILIFVSAGCCNRGTTTVYAESWYDADELCDNECKSTCVTWDTDYVSSGIYDCTCQGVLD